MERMKCKGEKVVIRKAVKSYAKPLIEYLNIIGGESEFLTFEISEFGVSVLKKHWVNGEEDSYEEK